VRSARRRSEIICADEAAPSPGGRPRTASEAACVARGAPARASPTCAPASCVASSANRLRLRYARAARALRATRALRALRATCALRAAPAALTLRHARWGAGGSADGDKHRAPDPAARRVDVPRDEWRGSSGAARRPCTPGGSKW